MKIIKLISIYILLFSCESIAQESFKYILTVHEKYSFGEYSYAGRYNLTLMNENDEDILSLDFYQNEEQSQTKYLIILDEPFLQIGSNFKNGFQMTVDKKIINEQIDSIFSDAIKILESKSELISFVKLRKDNIKTSVTVYYKSDTIENALFLDCSRYLNTSTGGDYKWEFKFHPLSISYNYLNNNTLIKNESIDYQTNAKNISEYSWNADSTLLTMKLFNSNKTLIGKKIEEYLNGSLITSYNIDKATGEKDKTYSAKYIGENLMEEIFYQFNEVSSKIIYKYDDHNMAIEKLKYEKTRYDKDLQLVSSIYIDNEYNHDNSVKGNIFMNETKQPFLSVRYYRGMYK